MTARFADFPAPAFRGAGAARPPLDVEVAAAAGALVELGVGPGDRVLLSCTPSVDTVVAYLAVRACGAVVVPANTAYTERELRHIVDDVGPVCAVLSDVGRVRGLVPVAVTPAELLASAAGGSVLDRAVDPGSPAMIAYTSGTTGAPKGAVLTGANLDASAAAVVAAWGWTSADVLVLPLPLFHMHGLGVGVNGTVAAGATAVVLPRFDADVVFDAIAEHRATMLFGVPTMYSYLADHPRLPELATLRLCVSGSAPLAPDLWERIRVGSGQEVLERYGMSETAMLTSNPYDGPRRPGTVGLPLPGVDVRVAAEGGVEVRGPNVFDGYWRRPEATAEAFTADGWFRTGDVGRLDPDGYLRLVGRSSELIITGGYNVYPREVEDVLRGHPSVADVAVVGLPDERWGEVVAAFVVPDGAGALDPTALAEHAGERLAGYKTPRRWTTVEALPRNAMGKVQRDLLRSRGV